MTRIIAFVMLTALTAAAASAGEVRELRTMDGEFAIRHMPTAPKRI